MLIERKSSHIAFENGALDLERMSKNDRGPHSSIVFGRAEMYGWKMFWISSVVEKGEGSWSRSMKGGQQLTDLQHLPDLTTAMSYADSMSEKILVFTTSSCFSSKCNCC